jgi:hypothetical protein
MKSINWRENETVELCFMNGHNGWGLPSIYEYFNCNTMTAIVREEKKMDEYVYVMTEVRIQSDSEFVQTKLEF